MNLTITVKQESRTDIPSVRLKFVKKTRMVYPAKIFDTANLIGTSLKRSATLLKIIIEIIIKKFMESLNKSIKRLTEQQVFASLS